MRELFLFIPDRPGVCQLWKNDKSAFAGEKLPSQPPACMRLEKPSRRLPVSGDIHLRSGGAYATPASQQAASQQAHSDLHLSKLCLDQIVANFSFFIWRRPQNQRRICIRVLLLCRQRRTSHAQSHISHAATRGFVALTFKLTAPFSA
jgi:hypothetical protein